MFTIIYNYPKESTNDRGGGDIDADVVNKSDFIRLKIESLNIIILSSLYYVISMFCNYNFWLE